MIDGGLGSQMWQYAVGRGIRVSSGLPVSYDLSWYDKRGMDMNRQFSREYQLDSVFPNIALRKADDETIRLYQLYFDICAGTRFDFSESLLSSRMPRYMGGYYVNAKYVDFQGDDLRREFTFDLDISGENETIFARIASAACSVAVHVRRGDYVGSAFDVVTAEYFRRAMDLTKRKLAPRNPTFFIFSNDMAWSREAFRGMREELVFADVNDNDNGAADMYLMSECMHFVISNSSFSWWPAWLSRKSGEKIVVMPDRWLRNETEMNSLAMRAEGGQCCSFE
jgi:hypothetical protein